MSSYYSLSPLYSLPTSAFASMRSSLLANIQKGMEIGQGTMNCHSSGFIFRSGQSELRHDTDHEPIFRQESFFAALFGVREPDFWAMILPVASTSRPGAALSHTTVLIAPDLGEDYEIWAGHRKSAAEWATTYGVDQVIIGAAAVGSFLEVHAPHVRQLWSLGPGVGRNADSGSDHAGVGDIPEARRALALPTSVSLAPSPLLYWAAVEARTVKTGAIADLMRTVADVSAKAHVAVMEATGPGQREFEAEAEFRRRVAAYGCRHTSYTCICGSGDNGSALHYGHAGAPNDGVLQDGQLFLLDMGGELHFHGADISRTYPVNGTFTKDQAALYNTVLDSADAVIAAARPGVSYVELHELSLRTLIVGLRDRMGVVAADANVDDAFAAGIAQVFMPHGLGHMLGIDTHDVGGGERDPRYPTLRLTRELRAGYVVTVEPGAYFISMLLDRALADPKQRPFLVPERIDEYRGTGGVRIEDDILIVEGGCENMSAAAPRTVADVEAACRGGRGKRTRDN
mmetsp:Transcript_4633/g.15009  ORF Transcript_4633/g.15009 Transcript_4633/m.15009 type:complete len:514 (-) Transcript_4633:952-2493(-)